MLSIEIPGGTDLILEHLVLDYNGTLAQDGVLIAGVPEALIALAEALQIHVVTADTFGTARAALEGLSVEVEVLPAGDQTAAKQALVQRLGRDKTVAVGNGRNDRLMLEGAALGVVVILQEGAAVETLQAADVVCTDILAALELLGHPLRLTATLRS